MIQVSITSSNTLTNQATFQSQTEADAWYVQEQQNFPVGHVRTDATIQDPQAKVEAQLYLDSTDWMVVRQMDIQVPVPADVKSKREAARLTINSAVSSK